jgi:hypothetical protein
VVAVSLDPYFKFSRVGMIFRRSIDFYADIFALIPCQIHCADGLIVFGGLDRNADGNEPKRVGRNQMRTELHKSRPDISAKIRPFWIGPLTAYSRVLLECHRM